MSKQLLETFVTIETVKHWSCFHGNVYIIIRNIAAQCSEGKQNNVFSSSYDTNELVHYMIYHMIQRAHISRDSLHDTIELVHNMIHHMIL